MRLDSPLGGDAIVLRTLAPEDVTAGYLAWLHDADVNRYLEVRFAPPGSLEELAAFVASANASDDTLLLGIFLRAARRHIGNIKLGPIDRRHSVADIGLLIGDKAEWGKGRATEAISLLSDHAFGSLGLLKLTASCYAANEGSAKAFVRAGFLVEGRRRSQWQVGGTRQDGVLLGRVNVAALAGSS